MSSLRQLFLRHRAWLIVGLTILLVLTIRVRLRQMPLERDEGEYAYAGQLILQGVPPFKEAYNMKLPGTYAAYALIMAVFGQTDSAIHVGVALINAASILLLFLIGRKILDEPAGVVAAISYALLSTGQSVLGLAGHATHFVVLPALAGTLFLLRAREHALNQALNPEFNRSEQREQRFFKGPFLSGFYSSVSSVICCSSLPRAGSTIFLAGLLFGLAFLMKQHGIFFGIFGGLYLAFSHIYLPQTIKEKRERLASERRSRIGKSGSDREQAQTEKSTSSHSTTPSLHHSDSGPVRVGPRRGSKLPPIAWPTLYKELTLFSVAFALPYVLTCLILWAAGVFPQFTFWTITYARKYAAGLPVVLSNAGVRWTLDAVSGPNLLLWIIPWLGAVLLGWERRLAIEHRFFLVALLLCSFGSISVGFYFRQHYFITLLPVMALLTGLAVSRAIRLVKHDVTIELFIAIPIFILFGAGCLISLCGNGSTWFAQSPVEVVDLTYSTSLFTEARKLAESIRDTSQFRSSLGKSGSDREEAQTEKSKIQNPKSKIDQSLLTSAATTKQQGHTRIAILGSEPEIYFYSRRRSATGYIYMYPLMEIHPYATQMQQGLISQIETNNPEYVIYVDYPSSWSILPDSSRLFEQWWQNYSANLELLQTINLQPPQEAVESEDPNNPIPRGHLLLYRPKMNR